MQSCHTYVLRRLHRYCTILNFYMSRTMLLSPCVDFDGADTRVLKLDAWRHGRTWDCPYTMTWSEGLVVRTSVRAFELTSCLLHTSLTALLCRRKKVRQAREDLHPKPETSIGNFQSVDSLIRFIRSARSQDEGRSLISYSLLSSATQKQVHLRSKPFSWYTTTDIQKGYLAHPCKDTYI